MSLQPRKPEYTPKKLVDEVQNRQHQRNAHQIIDITMGSPGNVALTSFKPLSNTIMNSPVRVGATFENSNWALPKSKQEGSAVGSMRKDLPQIGLPPTGKRARNTNQLPQISNTMMENQIQNLRNSAANIDQERLSQKRSVIVSQARSSQKQDKDALRSQILDHLVDRVSKHESDRKSRRSSHKQQASEILQKLRLDMQDSGSKGSKRLGLGGSGNYRQIDDAMYKTGFTHYDNSPVAKHYYADPGFLMTFNGTIPERVGFNRKIKMRDTFTKIFPSYNHEPATCYQPTNTHSIHFYPSKWDDGSPSHKIDRKYTHKFDEIKIYNEEMLKIAEIADMRRPRRDASKKAK